MKKGKGGKNQILLPTSIKQEKFQRERRISTFSLE